MILYETPCKRFYVADAPEGKGWLGVYRHEGVAAVRVGYYGPGFLARAIADADRRAKAIDQSNCIR